MKALYRKYRPMSLNDVVGQEQVTSVLKNSLKHNKINHAYLFVGPRGCGKTSVARILAHEVNGFEYQIEDNYVDIVEIDGASNRGIDNIRELREKVMIAPTVGKYKVYIIDEVHMLTKEAFNALLKTLEEPPSHVIFIMATTDAYKVPITITSRSQVFTFRLSDNNTMFKYLENVAEKEHINISEDALKIIVKKGGGSYRDSLSLLDQISTLSESEITKDLVISALGLPDDVLINKLLESYINFDNEETVSTLKVLLSSGIKPETLSEELISIILAKPRTELFTLLKNLTEIRPPFSDAKLLIALFNPLGKTKTLEDKTSSTLRSKSQQPTRKEVATVVSVENKIEFNWNIYLEKVKNVNDAIYSQLIKCKFAFSDGNLELYPSKKIIKTILSRDNNKQLLNSLAGQNVKITIHDISDTPDDLAKDDTLSKISDIMGGEVINDGGENPF